MDVSSVGLTGVVTAHMRALDSVRPDRLVSDPYAAALVDATGLGLADNVTHDSIDAPGGITRRVYESVAVRTHYLDTWCATVLADTTVTQIVILGAGLDTRALRLNWLADGHTVFEVDRADVAELKATELGVNSTERWHGVTADLTDSDWMDALITRGYRPDAPALFVAEGLFMYLSDGASRAIVDEIETASAAGTHLLGVHFGPGARIDADTQAMTKATTSAGYGFESVIDTTPQDWVGPKWCVHQPISIAALAPSLGRSLPYDEEAIGAEVTWLFAAELVAQ